MSETLAAAPASARARTAAPSGVAVSICAPMFREAATVDAFVAAIAAAADEIEASGCGPCEVVVVDDHSPDATLAELHRAAAAEPRLRVLALPANRGQLGATQAALAAARGDVVAVLDGDLQDPPELLPALVARAQRGDVDVVFATKARRDDAAWVRLGAQLYHALQRGLGDAAPPSGAGSFLAMRSQLARKVAAVDAGRANLAPLVSALALGAATLPYAKAARRDGASRVGPLGLLREAASSLAWSGALGRLVAGAAIGAAAGAFASALWAPPTWAAWVAAAGLLAGSLGLALAARRLSRRPQQLRALRAAP